MVWFISIFCILVVAFNLFRYKNILDPLNVFFLIWAILVPLSSVGLYNIDVPSEHTYTIIMIGLIGYFVGCILGKKIRFTFAGKGNHTLNDPNIKAVINYRFLYVICGISILYFFYMATRVLPMLLSGRGLAYIRALAVADEQNELRSSTLLVSIKNFIATPTVYLSIAILPIDRFLGKKDKLFFSMTIIMIVLWVLSTGGRSIILWEVVYLLVVYIYLNRGRKFFKTNRKMKTRTKVLLIFGIVVLFYFLLQTTLSRKGSGVDLLRQVCIYFVAPVGFFDKWVTKIDTLYSHYHSYGFASFYGLSYPFILIFKIIHIIPSNDSFFTVARELSFKNLQRTISIGRGFYMNAFATVFFQPYIDGRLIGVFIILCIFGYYCSFVFARLNERNDSRYMLFYLLAFQKILFSMVRFYYTQPAQSICFVMSFFAIVYKRHVSNNNQNWKYVKTIQKKVEFIKD